MKYITLIPGAANRMRKDFIREHSKFIHSSWCILEDLDKKVEMYGITYTIAGLWDVIGFKKQILLKAENGTYAYVDSQEVANALGYTKFRNLVTGKEVDYDLAAEYRLKKARKLSVIPAEGYEDETEEIVSEVIVDEDAIVEDDFEFAEDESYIPDMVESDDWDIARESAEEDLETEEYREDDIEDEND